MSKTGYLKLSDIADTVPVTLRTLQRCVRCNLMPEPDLVIGRSRFWKPETIQEWLASSRPKKAPKRTQSYAG
jgi:hypothetical protein